MKWPFLTLVFKALLWLTIISMIITAYGAIFPFGITHPFSYNGFSDYILWGALKALFLYALIIFLCAAKKWIVFPIVILLNGYFLFIKVPISGYPVLWLISSHASFESKALILRMLVEVLISVIGISIILKEYYKVRKA